MRIKTKYTSLRSSDETISLPDEIHVTKAGAVACHAASGDIPYPSLEALCAAYKVKYVPAFQLWLQTRHACDKARAWIGDRDAETTWRECLRPDWMLWALDVLVNDLQIAGDSAAAAAIADAADSAETAGLTLLTNRERADIVRKVVPWEMVEATLWA